MSQPVKVIVFGPTGNVGSEVAMNATQKGTADVFLAMRDPDKSLEVQLQHLPRVKADLFDPASVSEAIRSSGAKRAFVYLAHGNKYGMRASLEAMKEAGIEFVVFLSSMDVPINPAEAKQEDLIAWLHAQVELNLRDIFGPKGYVAVRAGAFATNLLRHKSEIKSGEVHLYRPEARTDHISAVDIGAVAGALLTLPASSSHLPTHGGKTELYIFGPHILSEADAFQTIAKVLGKEVRIKEISASESVEQAVQHGVPRPIADALERYTRKRADSGKAEAEDMHPDGVKNVEIFKSAPGETLEQWVKRNKHLFSI